MNDKNSLVNNNIDIKYNKFNEIKKIKLQSINNNFNIKSINSSIFSHKSTSNISNNSKVQQNKLHNNNINRKILNLRNKKINTVDKEISKCFNSELLMNLNNSYNKYSSYVNFKNSENLARIKYMNKSISKKLDNKNKIFNTKKQIINELKLNLPLIESKLRHMRKMYSVQQQIEKIELSHIEGKLKEDIIQSFKLEEDSSLNKKHIKNNSSIFFKKNIVPKFKIIKENSVKDNSKDIINIEDFNEKHSNENKDNESINSIIDKNKLKNKKYINFCNNNNNNENAKQESDLPIRFEQNEEEILQQFILFNCISQNKELLLIYKLLKKENLEKIKYKYSSRDAYYLGSKVKYMFNGDFLDEETKMKIENIKKSSKNLNYLMNIIYPKLMNEKQKNISQRISQSKSK